MVALRVPSSIEKKWAGAEIEGDVPAILCNELGPAVGVHISLEDIVREWRSLLEIKEPDTCVSVELDA
jgi:hypothetical protein